MKKKIISLSLLSLLLLTASLLRANASLPGFFSDNMVLQADEPVVIWGAAEPGEKLTVSLMGMTIPSQADTAGKWKIMFPPIAAGKSSDLVIQADNKITIMNIVMGDVWFLSGQSNMDMALRSCTNLPAALADSSYPFIRYFRTDNRLSTEPLEDSAGKWKVLSPETAGDLSGVGFYFGREIHNKTKRPIGLIVSSWVGTTIEAWIPRGDLLKAGFTNMTKQADKITKTGALSPLAMQNRQALLDKIGRVPDPGDSKESAQWPAPKTPLKGWETMRQPGYWENKGLDIDGVVWFRKEIDLPKDWSKKDLSLELGAIDDFDVTYFNGTKVGSTESNTPQWWSFSRKYKVPGDLVKPGKNVIVVRIFDNYAGGGFCGNPEEMRIRMAESEKNQSVPLAGEWYYRVATQYDRTMLPLSPENTPTALYNGMVAPFIKMPVKGILWYQGESNAERAVQYRRLFPLLINAWRKAWSRDMPFYYVQLANFRPTRTEPSESAWAELRDAQTLALSLPKTGMATAIDIGDSTDLHPKNKKTVGERLALIALGDAYGKPVEFMGPMMASSVLEGNSIRIKFTHALGLKTVDNSEPVGFAIAGKDKKFVWAKARIEGDSVIIRNDQVASPVGVRYMWADNPRGNLINVYGLPMFPFRTDTFPMLTKDWE